MSLWNAKIFMEKFKSCLAFSATLGGFLLIFYPPGDLDTKRGIAAVVAFIIANVLAAIILAKPKKKISLDISKKVKLNIFYGDIFDSSSNIVIPVNEYFDTLVDNVPDTVISSRTLHGKFVKLIYGGNVAELDVAIENALSSVDCNINPTRKKGKTKKYNIGQTICISKDGKKYSLLAFSKFDEYNKAYLSKKNYQLVIQDLFDHLHVISQGEEVNMPLIGAGQSGINLTKQELLEYLIFSLKMCDDLTLSGGINIVLHESLRKELDLNKIEFISKRGGF